MIKQFAYLVQYEPPTIFNVYFYEWIIYIYDPHPRFRY